MRKILSVFIAAALCFGCVSVSACGRNGNGDYDYLFERDDDDVYIRYFVGGNSEDSLYEIADNFVKETGIGVYLEPSNSVTNEIPTLLKNAHPTNGSPSAAILKQLPDVAMTQTIKWQSYVNKGYLANLDEVYSYQYADEGNVTFRDKLVDGAKDFGLMGQTPDDAADGNKHYWVVPWTSPLTGIVYNVKMLKSLGGKWADGRTPSTVTELIELTEALAKAGKTSFAWGGDGTNMGYWNFLFMSLWTSYQGYDTSFEDGAGKFGSVQDFLDFQGSDGSMDGASDGYEVFNQAGRKIALQALRDLIVDQTANTWKNSIKDPVSKTVYEAQEKFAFEEAAMMVNGSWIQNEIKDNIEDGFEYKMMPMPAVDYAYVQKVSSQLGLSAKEIHGGLLADGTFETSAASGPSYATVNNTEIGDVVLVPQNAVHKTDAIKFLQYFNSKKSVEAATKSMNIARPFNYKPSEIGEVNGFTESVFSVYEKPNAVHIVRKSESSLFTYAGIKEWAAFNEADVLLKMYNQNALDLIRMVYNNAVDNWPLWLEQAEVV